MSGPRHCPGLALVTVYRWMNDRKDGRGFCLFQSLPHRPGWAGSPDSSPRPAAESQGEPGQGPSTQGTPAYPPTLCHKVHLCPSPLHNLPTILEVSLREAASQRQTRSLKWISSQESWGNWPGRVSQSTLGQRAKHELTLPLIIARPCMAARGFTVYQDFPSESSHGSSQKTPWTDRTEITTSVLEMKNWRGAQEGGSCPKSHRETSKQDSGYRLQTLCVCTRMEGAHELGWEGEKKKKKSISLFSSTSI